jgi:hypothetical protein
MTGTKELVAFCGIYCGDCFIHKGEIADLARDLRKELRGAKFGVFAEAVAPFFKEFKNYDECYAVLGGMVKLRCKRACKGGGANPGCKIRLCCQKKGYVTCAECADFETCGKLEFLKAVHGEANLKNLRKLKKYGVERFVAGARDWAF